MKHFAALFALLTFLSYSNEPSNNKTYVDNTMHIVNNQNKVD